MFQADSVEITVMVENWIDMLLPDVHMHGCSTTGHDLHCVSRAGLIHHFDPKQIPPQAENGISFLVRAQLGRATYTCLFDVGLTGSVLAHNFTALHQNPHDVDHVVISHGHPDHYGGIFGFLGLLERHVPVATHDDAFRPRYAVMADGQTSPFYNAAFSHDAIDGAGGRPVLCRDPVELGCGVFTTGEIARIIDFEAHTGDLALGTPGLYQVNGDGNLEHDEVRDEQALVIDVRGEGLVVLTGCAHAGVINTLVHAQRLRGDRPIRAVLGGFHLGFPTTPAENVDKTTEALAALDVGVIVPMHCSGLRAHTAMSARFGDRYVQPAVGAVFRFGR